MRLFPCVWLFQVAFVQAEMRCPPSSLIPKCSCIEDSHLFRGPYVTCSDLQTVDDLRSSVQGLKGNPIEALHLYNVSLPYIPREGLFLGTYIEYLFLNTSDFMSFGPPDSGGPSPFVGLETSVKDIKLENMQMLSNVDWEDLSGLTHLSGLEIYNCSLGDIGPSFSKLPQDMNYIFILKGNVTSIASSAFAQRNMTTISVINNNISKLDKYIFAYNSSSLQAITFNLNHVKEISDDFFTQLPALNLVDIGRNELTRLPSSLRNQWTQIESIYLAGNNFACNCDLVWLLTAAKQHPPKYHDLQFVTCESPPSLKGKNLLSLQETDMCP